MSFVKEFKEFAVKGNAIDLAVGVIIGGAFGKIVSSLVSDIIMPPLGILIGGVKMSELEWVMKAASIDEKGETVSAVAIKYGNFLQASFDFLIIAFSIFLFVRLINKMKRKQEAEVIAEAPAPETPADIKLLEEIRDLLKNK